MRTLTANRNPAMIEGVWVWKYVCRSHPNMHRHTLTHTHTPTHTDCVQVTLTAKSTPNDSKQLVTQNIYANCATVFRPPLDTTKTPKKPTRKNKSNCILLPCKERKYSYIFLYIVYIWGRPLESGFDFNTIAYCMLLICICTHRYGM